MRILWFWQICDDEDTDFVIQGQQLPVECSISMQEVNLKFYADFFKTDRFFMILV